MVRFEHVQRELGTFLDKEEEAEKETDRLLVDKTKLNWKYSNKFLKQVSGIDLNLANLHCSRGVARCPPKKMQASGWAMGYGQWATFFVAHCPLPKNANSRPSKVEGVDFIEGLEMICFNDLFEAGKKVSPQSL